MRISKYSKSRASTKGRFKPRVCITMGYPAGIGPEIIIKALASPAVRRLANFLIIGDYGVFKKASLLIGKKLICRVIKREEEIDFSRDSVLFMGMGNLPLKGFAFGKISGPYGKASIDYIDKAVSLIKKKKVDILVTAPIHKHAAELSGFKYPGHTEYLAHLSGAKDYAMMLMADRLRVMLATTHMPLKDVPNRLNRGSIIDLIILADISLRRYFGIKKPKIAVCGLNPHAGEDGLFGKEEIKIISPAIRSVVKRDINASGPHSADAVFHDAYKGLYDAVVCMYHDQGLVALKMLGRDRSVNVTLGLPFIRTSPGHGTALNIAAKGIASCESMKKAIKTAIAMHKNRD